MDLKEDRGIKIINKINKRKIKLKDCYIHRGVGDACVCA